ncbi:MAG: hypothetical protein ACPK7O_06775 [Methanobacterium sp.]
MIPMSKIAVIGIGAALLLAFLFACIIVGFALLGGAQEDVGYAPMEDVGSGSIDAGYGDYDVVDTYMELELPIWEINSPSISFRS